MMLQQVQDEQLGNVQKISGIFCGNCYQVTTCKSKNFLFVKFTKIPVTSNVKQIVGFYNYLYKMFKDYEFNVDDYQNDGDNSIIYVGKRRKV